MFLTRFSLYRRQSLMRLHAAVIMLAVWFPAFASAAQITIAAAADLTFAFRDVAPRFEKASGNTVKLSLGSSGNFYSQIRNGAPYDLFFSADMSYPEKLAEAGLVEGPLYEYATGKIVLWAPARSAIDVSRGLPVLLDPAVHKIAVANPKLAPYGKAAVAALQHDHIYDRVEKKLVFGENISQTAQFVQSGNADVGILALSLAVAPAMKDKGKYFVISTSSYPPLRQAGVVIKASKNQDVARQFLAFLKTPEIVDLMHSYGFILPKDLSRKPGSY
ncbi:MAG: molybdate ABC transporter substrate-binding protein [Candidatus Binataceae bacterium]